MHIRLDQPLHGSVDVVDANLLGVTHNAVLRRKVCGPKAEEGGSSVERCAGRREGYALRGARDATQPTAVLRRRRGQRDGASIIIAQHAQRSAPSISCVSRMPPIREPPTVRRSVGQRRGAVGGRERSATGQQQALAGGLLCKARVAKAVRYRPTYRKRSTAQVANLQASKPPQSTH